MGSERSKEGSAEFEAKVKAFRRLIKVEMLITGLYHVSLPRQKDLTSTFLRFQEHYESPEFKGKTFSLRQFKTWYAGENGGRFTYLTDWSGFNIPGRIMCPFVEGDFGRLSYKEVALIAAVKSFISKFQKFDNYSSWYLIGTYEVDADAETTIAHECAHALFYLDPIYRRMTTRLTLRLLGRGDIESFLTEEGYHKDVFLDEIQAYLATGSQYIANKIDINLYMIGAIALRLMFVDTWNRKLAERDS